MNVMMDMLSKGMVANINNFPLWRFEPTEEQAAEYRERKQAIMKALRGKQACPR
jgi:hypothetical protein